MTLSNSQAPGGRSPANTSQEETTTSGIPPIELSRFWLNLWSVATQAMFLSWNTAPLSEEEITSLGTQLGDLLRYLARRHIYPLDDTIDSPPLTRKEDSPHGQ